MSKTLYQVFKNLAWPDLCQAALVCKAWREVRVVYSFCFCAETQIGTIVVMVASFPPALFFLFRQQKIPLYGRTFPSWRGWPWLTSLVSSGQAGQSYGYSHVFFPFFPWFQYQSFTVLYTHQECYGWGIPGRPAVLQQVKLSAPH